MLTVTPLALPERHDDPDWLSYQALGRRRDHELVHGPGWDVSPEAALREAVNGQAEYRAARFVARLDGEAVGFGLLLVNFVDDPQAGDAYVYVLPERRGQGIGTALAEALGGAAREQGLTRLEAWVMVDPHGEPRLVPSTGVGSVPAEAPGIRFAIRHGFKLGQVERVSRYDFDDPAVDPHDALATATAAAGPDYELLCFDGAAPEELLADLAAMRARMSTDPPAGGVEMVEQEWDATRLKERDDRLLQVRRFWRAVVRHVPSGRLVALSEIARIHDNPDAFLEQWDTLVVPEHRGHRLGMLVKAANLIQVREAAPDAKALMTWNAEENRYMLSVNEALGFREVLVQAGLQRKDRA